LYAIERLCILRTKDVAFAEPTRLFSKRRVTPSANALSACACLAKSDPTAAPSPGFRFPLHPGYAR
jgi:hypothetical protein